MAKPKVDKKYLFLRYYKDIAIRCPLPESEYNFDAMLGRKHRFDFAWPDRKVAVEIDGNAWQVKGGGRHGTDKDREKSNLAAMLGWRVLHFSPQQLIRDPVGGILVVLKTLGLIKIAMTPEEAVDGQSGRIRTQSSRKALQ